ncbi:MAG: hypothetical protein ABSA78_22035 [Candidatus Sulfotelmatobacter sp.]
MEKYSNLSLQELEGERKHLETLFAERINFYLVFAAGVLAFLFGDSHSGHLEKVALSFVTVVSVLMIMALLRTFFLVKGVLDEIVDKHSSKSVYAFYRAEYSWLPNANYVLLFLPIALTVFFAYALVRSLC